MGKGHRHLKKLKSEKAKVKLKQSKKLKKADNITDTSFKVKQIVVREQLKVINEAEPLSKRKLNIKELLSRLQHHNLSVRTDAITGLKEIVKLYPNDVIVPNLSQILHGISHLVLDKEKTARGDGIKLISLVLSAVHINQISPFFDILCSYLRCAMTHINTRIQEDSLLLLDILLKCVPSVVAQNSNKILPNFFDLISKLRNDFKPGRTLTVNLGSKITSVKWRTKVLNSFYQILIAIVKEREKKFNSTEKNSEVKTVKFDPRNKNFISIQPRQMNLFPLTLDEKKISTESCMESEQDIIKYIEILIPLLFETWLEVGPNKSNENNIDSNISSDSVSILSSTLNILKMFWQYIELYEKEVGNKEISNQFLSKYRNDFTNYFVKQIPYINTNIRKRKRNEDKIVVTDCMCVKQNLTVCYLFCVFNKKFNGKFVIGNANKTLNYVKDCLQNWKPENREAYPCLLLVLRSYLDVSKSWAKHNLDMASVVDSVVAFYRCRYLTESMKFQLFGILSDVLSHNQFNKLPSFETWLQSLPGILCKPGISENIINIVSLLGKQKNIIFNDAFRKKLPNILENLEHVKIIDNDNKYLVLNNLIESFYWLSIYDEESLAIIGNFVNQCQDEKIQNSIIELLKLRYNLREDQLLLNTMQDLKLCI